MSFAEIEAALEHLTPDELHRIALKSWAAFVEKEGQAPAAHDCDEDDPQLLGAIDEAVAKAAAAPGSGHSADAVRQRLSEWTSR